MLSYAMLASTSTSVCTSRWHGLSLNFSSTFRRITLGGVSTASWNLTLFSSIERFAFTCVLARSGQSSTVFATIRGTLTTCGDVHVPWSSQQKNSDANQTSRGWSPGTTTFTNLWSKTTWGHVLWTTPSSLGSGRIALLWARRTSAAWIMPALKTSQKATLRGSSLIFIWWASAHTWSRPTLGSVVWLPHSIWTGRSGSSSALTAVNNRRKTWTRFAADRWITEEYGAYKDIRRKRQNSDALKKAIFVHQPAHSCS